MKNTENSVKMTTTQSWSVIETSQTDLHSAKLVKELADILFKKNEERKQFLDRLWLDCCNTWTAMDLQSYTPYKLPLQYLFIAPTFEVAQQLKDLFANDERYFVESFVRDIPGNKTWRIVCSINKQLPEASDIFNWVQNMHGVGEKVGCRVMGEWGFGDFDYEPVCTPERAQELEEMAKNEPLIWIQA